MQSDPSRGSVFLLFHCLVLCSCFRCQAVSPPPLLSSGKGPNRSSLNDGEDLAPLSRYARGDCKLHSQWNWREKSASLRTGASLSADFESQSRLIKARSISCLDKRLSIFKPNPPADAGGQEQKENQQQQQDQQPSEATQAREGLSGGPLSWSTLSLGPSSSAASSFSSSSAVINHSHKRTLSLSRTGVGPTSATIRKKISEWECRRVSLPRMSLCLEKRPGGGAGERGGGDGLLPSPCSEKSFDFKGVRRMSTAFSECSYPETEEDEAGASDRESLGRFQKKLGKTEGSSIFLRSLSARKETSAVLNRIQKIEQALKDSPSPPQYLSNSYGLDKVRQKSFTIGGLDDCDSACASKRSSICSIATEPDLSPASERLTKLRQRFSVCSARSESPEPHTGTPVNPLPKPRRTFEYDANRNHKGATPSNGLPPSSESPPPLPSTPAPSLSHNPKTDGGSPKKTKDR